MRTYKSLKHLLSLAHAPPRRKAERLLDSSVSEPLRLIWGLHAFSSPKKAHLVCSPHQYHLRCETGPMIPGLDAAVGWEIADDLRINLREAQFAVVQQTTLGQQSLETWHSRFVGPTIFLERFAWALYYADRGAMCIRSRSGLWCQTYETGWPKMPPILICEDQRSGLMVSASMSPSCSPDLPFTHARVQDAIPDLARPYVTLDWHHEDDIVPECSVDPRCSLNANRISDWLMPLPSSQPAPRTRRARRQGTVD